MGAVLTDKQKDKVKRAFLDALPDSTVSDACTLAGVARCTVYAWRKKDRKFAEEWDELTEAATDRIETNALRIATEGTLEPVIYKGAQAVDKDGQPLFIRKQHPTLIMFMLERRRREVYARTGPDVEVNVNSGVLVAPARMTPEDWIAQQERENAEADRLREN